MAQHAGPDAGLPHAPTSAPTSAPPDAVLDVDAAVRAWLPGRRWFPAKGSEATFQHVARITYPGPPEPAPQVFVEVLRAPDAGPDGAPIVLQVPLVLETVPPDGDAGTAPVCDGLISAVGSSRLYDGAHHPAFVAAWLGAATWSPTAPDSSPTFDLRGLHVLTGEQSNTSVLLPHVDGGAMLKILRSLAPGQNPDVVVPRALTRVGWSGVPAPYAWSTITLAALHGPADSDGQESPWTAHSGVLAELVPNARDGFELACDHAGQGRPFDDLARDLGLQIAQMHAALRDAFPADVAAADVTWLLTALRRRVASAATSSRAVAARAHQIDAFWHRLRAVADDAVRAGRPLPPLQRIHGDLHLGQALHSAGTGWRILDFEGEPLRPVLERTRPDLGERDVAGMLRSIDYAAAVGRATDPGWAQSARRSFLEGYYGTPAPTDRGVVLDAFELDKALYEVVYEERNRPSWVAIPLAAVDRILSTVSGEAEDLGTE